MIYRLKLALVFVLLLSVNAAADPAIENLRRTQKPDGSWTSPILTSSILNNAYMIFLYEYLGKIDEKKEITENLMKFIWSQQASDGGFSGYSGGPNSVGMSTLAYLSGKFTGENELSPRMLALENSILRSGGLAKADFTAQPFLLLFGINENARHVPGFGLNLILRLENELPWAKVLAFPLMYLLGQKHIHELSADKFPTRLGAFKNPSSSNDKKVAIKGNEKFFAWTDQNIGEDGTLFDYTPTTIPTLMALSTRPDKYSLLIEKGIRSLEAYVIPLKEGLYQSPGEASIGETAVLLTDLLELGVSANDPMVKKAAEFLFAHRNPVNKAYGFSKNNSKFPDVDDTAINVRALSLFEKRSGDQTMDRDLNLAMEWVVRNQNRDGGFGTWEKNRHPFLQKLLKRAMKSNLVLSESVVEQTSRITVTLSKLKNASEIFANAHKKSIKWLLKNQKPNGSFDATWTVGYAFGTAAALEALATASSEPKVESAILRGLKYLTEVRHSDGGGWGESVESFSAGQSVQLSHSSPSQTGFVISELLSFLKEENYKHWKILKPMLTESVAFLESTRHADGRWQDQNWTGVTFPGLEYLIYPNIHEFLPAYSILKFRQVLEMIEREL